MDIDTIQTNGRLDKLQTNNDRLKDRLDKITRPTNPQYSPRLCSQGPPFRPARHQSAPPRFRPVPQRPQTDPLGPEPWPRSRRDINPLSKFRAATPVTGRPDPVTCLLTLSRRALPKQVTHESPTSSPTCGHLTDVPAVHAEERWVIYTSNVWKTKTRWQGTCQKTRFGKRSLPI